ncbi:MAG: hypothetical protein RLZZ511_3493 [Cyanobacteriota bacterium]|jgi:Protein of unknown function (DUF3143)
MDTFSPMPSPDTALYNHPLPTIEAWLVTQGCERDTHEAHLWRVQREHWSATIELDVDQIIVSYHKSDGQDLSRAFKYGLSREDIEAAIFAGP